MATVDPMEPTPARPTVFTRMALTLASAACLLLAGCALAGYSGESYPKPEYNRIEQPGDAVFFFESDFGVQTRFKVKTHASADADATACQGAQRVAYLQEMDSYWRRPAAPGEHGQELDGAGS